MKTLSTIVNANVTVSDELDFAVDVVYTNPETNVKALATVVNTDMHGENGGLIVGTVMCKRYSLDDVVVHPVARDTATGRFVTLKGTKHSVISAATEQMPHILNVEVEFESEAVSLAEAIQEAMTNSVAELPMAEPLAPIVNITFEKPKPVTTIGRKDKPALAAPVLPERVIVTPQPVVEEPAYPIDEDMTVYNDPEFVDPFEGYVPELPEMDMMDIIPFDVNGAVMQEHTGNIQVDEVFEQDTLTVVKKACRITYNFFYKELRVNTINPNQMEKLLSIIWNVNSELHPHKDVVDYYVLGYVMHCYMNRLGNSKFLNKAIVQDVVKKALVESVEMVKAA